MDTSLDNISFLIVANELIVSTHVIAIIEFVLSFDILESIICIELIIICHEPMFEDFFPAHSRKDVGGTTDSLSVILNFTHDAILIYKSGTPTRSLQFTKRKRFSTFAKRFGYEHPYGNWRH